MFAKFINGPFEGDFWEILEDVFDIHISSVMRPQTGEVWPIEPVRYHCVGSESNGHVRLFAIRPGSELVLTAKDRKFLKSLHVAVD